jgi:hypothetical protein
MSRVAIIGVGQTHHQRRRADVNVPGLVREAAQRALADAKLEMSDIDSVVVASGPVLFAAVNQPEKWVVDALGARGKPVVRITSGGTRAFILTYRIEARERRLTIGAWPDWSVTAAREEAKRLKRWGHVASPKRGIKGQIFGHCQRWLQGILAGDITKLQRMARRVCPGRGAFQQHLTARRRQQPGKHAQQA